MKQNSAIICSIGINRQPVFFNEGNLQYFLDKYLQYSRGYWQTAAWCLLENHFHFLIKLRPVDSILEQGLRDFKLVDKNFLRKLPQDLPGARAADLPGFKNLANLAPANLANLATLIPHQLATYFVSERLRRWLLGYAKAINKQQERTGSLFQKVIRRKLITDENHLKFVATYIHRNPVHHFYVTNVTEYRWSSYRQSYMTNSPTDLNELIFNPYESMGEMRRLMHASIKSWKQYKDEDFEP